MAIGWKPVLDGALAEEAIRSAREVVEALSDDSSFHSASESTYWPGLSGGHAGLAVCLAYVGRALGDHQIEERAVEHWNRAVDALAEHSMHSAFYSGLTGIAWATAWLERNGVLQFGDEDPYAEIDERLRAELGSWDSTHHYDLISGLTGIGVYGMERRARVPEHDVLPLVVDRLVDLLHWNEHGAAWFTPPELVPQSQRSRAPGGYWNLGVAHGIPGALALVAASRQLGVDVDSEALESTTRWLGWAAHDVESGRRFTNWLPEPTLEKAPPSRVAWCYGDLGISAAFALAAECGVATPSPIVPRWRALSLDLARRCVGVDDAASGVRDHSVCHGTAGNALVFARLAHRLNDPTLHSEAKRWYERTLSLRFEDPGIAGYVYWSPERGSNAAPRHTGEPGLLTGAAGVAMSLVAGATEAEPTWDSMLLLSAPTRDNQASGRLGS